MSIIGGTDKPLVTRAGLLVFVRQHRAALENNSGRAVLQVGRVGDEFRSHADADPDQDARRKRTEQNFDSLLRKCASAKDIVMAGFYREAMRVWRQYDEEEIVMCLISADGHSQIQLVPKPWVEAPHEHCACGVRAGTDRRHDEGHVECDVVDAALEALAGFLDTDNAEALLSYTRAVLVRVYGIYQELTGTSPRDRLAAFLGAALCTADGSLGDMGVGDAPDDPHLAGCVEKVWLDVAQKMEHDGPVVLPSAADVITVAIESRRRGGDSLALPTSDPVDPSEWTPGLVARVSRYLESLGAAGAAMYGRRYREAGKPMVSAGTPYPVSEMDARGHATAQRRDAFWEERRAGASSASLLDHYFDELLFCQKALTKCNLQYVSNAAQERGNAMIELCLLTRGDAVAEKIKR